MGDFSSKLPFDFQAVVFFLKKTKQKQVSLSPVLLCNLIIFKSNFKSLFFNLALS